MRYAPLMGAFAVVSSLFFVGCSNSDHGKSKDHSHGEQKSLSDKIITARAKLSVEDQKLVAGQEFCAVMTDSRLGEMGTPLKIMVKDEPVFLCCKSCQKKALADPDKTIANVVELRAKAKIETEKK